MFVSLGALFDVNVNENKQILQYAIDKANENLLSGEEFQLEGQVADVVYGNEITVSRGLCSLLEVGNSLIFSPRRISSSYCMLREYFFHRKCNNCDHFSKPKK